MLCQWEGSNVKPFFVTYTFVVAFICMLCKRYVMVVVFWYSIGDFDRGLSTLLCLLFGIVLAVLSGIGISDFQIERADFCTMRESSRDGV